MFSAELHRFPIPTNFISCFNVNNINDKKLKNTINGLPFNRKVTLHIPGSDSIPHVIKDILCQDAVSYIVKELNISELCKAEFIQAFVHFGKFQASSCNCGLDTNNGAAFSPSGILTLLLDKLTYNRLGISGNLSKYILRKPKNKFWVEIDTQKNFDFGSNNYEKIHQNFKNSPLYFDMRITWVPNNITICPSSVQKYLSDLGYQIIEEKANYKEHITEIIDIPSFQNTGNLDAIECLNWLGYISLGIPYDKSPISLCKEDNISTIREMVLADSEGFYTSTDLNNVITKARGWLVANKDIPWIAVTSFGDEDCCVGFDNENTFRLNGHNHYTVILRRENAICIRVEASKKCDRYYDKSSNN